MTLCGAQQSETRLQNYLQLEAEGLKQVEQVCYNWKFFTHYPFVINLHKIKSAVNM